MARASSVWLHRILSSLTYASSDAAAAWACLPQLPAAARAYAKPPEAAAAERWRTAATLAMSRYFLTPPVVHMEGMPLPSALSWLRRRGPDIPSSLMFRLFRQGQVRILREGKVARASRSRELQDGDALLVPHAALKQDLAPLAPGLALQGLAGHSQEAWREAQPANSTERHPMSPATGSSADQHDPADNNDLHRQGTSTHSSGSQSQQQGQQEGHHVAQWTAERPSRRPSSSSATSSREGSSSSAMPRATPEAVRSWLLATERDLFVINKPAGIAVQGPTPGNLADILPEALGFGQQEAPRLVHRLDQRVSGAMLIARSANAAAWLSRALQSKPAAAAVAVAAKMDAGRARQRHKAESAGDEAAEGDVPDGMYIRRTYWALVQGDLQGKRSGRLRSMLHIEGQSRLAITDYTVRAADEGVAWLELTPHTGRKHQLRIHCSKLLGAPIIGDYKYSYRDSIPSRQLAPKLAEFLAQQSRRGADAGQGLALAAAARLAGAHSRRSSGSGSSSSSSGGSGASRYIESQQAGAGGSGRGTSDRAGNTVAGSPLVPIFLHSRSIVVGRPRKAPLRVAAPLPRYMKDLVLAMRWQMPPEAKQRVLMRSAVVQPPARGLSAGG